MYLLFICEDQVIAVDLKRTSEIFAYANVEVVWAKATLLDLIYILKSEIRNSYKAFHLEGFSQKALREIYKRIEPSRFNSVH